MEGEIIKFPVTHYLYDKEVYILFSYKQLRIPLFPKEILSFFPFIFRGGGWFPISVTHTNDFNKIKVKKGISRNENDANFRVNTIHKGGDICIYLHWSSHHYFYSLFLKKNSFFHKSKNLKFDQTYIENY